MKFLMWLLFTIAAATIAVLPEVAMYFVYGLINPQSELSRVLVLIVFWFGGVSACIGFALFGFLIFMAATQEALK